MIYPKVAIIGRPNVGKSTLFNRMVKGRDAIVGSEAGITRDRHDAFVFWKTKKFQIMDTGGIEPTASENLDLLMQKQVELALNEAQLVLFLLDAKYGVHPTDKIIAQSLRRKKKKVLWVINKVDVPRLEPDLYEFYELGTDAFYYISAEHALGIEQLLDDIVEELPESTEEEKIEEEVKIALVGRPNMGKSTLVNKLLGQERCLVSPEALTTRDAIDTYLVREHVLFTLIDTAGIRKRSKVDTDLEFYATTRSEKAIKRADVAFLLIDAEDGIVEQDLKIAHIAIESGTSLMILVNKWDLIHKDTKTAQEFEKDFRYKYPQFHWVPLIFLSALTGQRVHKLLDMSLGILEERRKRLTGDVLKLFLDRKLEELSPPFFRGKKPRISKLSQMDVSPPLFYFKTNPINSIKDSYKQYLQNALRDEFGFRATPLKCIFKKTIHRHRPYHS